MSQINIMALRHSAFYSPLLMTMAGGFLQKQGIDYSYSLATPGDGVDESLRNGSCHIAQSAVATSFSTLEQGGVVDIVHFAQINERDGFFLASREPDPGFSWGKLAGKKVLVDHFFQPMSMFQFGLHKMGVNIAELDIIDAGDVASIEEAFRNGVGDYVHMQGPVPQQLQHDGVAHVVAAVGDAVGPVAFSSICSTREWLESDLSAAFMSAYRDALAYVKVASPMEIASREREAGFFPDIDQEVLASTIAAYQQLGCWDHDGTISRRAYENLIEVFLFTGVITRRHPYEAAVTVP